MKTKDRKNKYILRIIIIVVFEIVIVFASQVIFEKESNKTDKNIQTSLVKNTNIKNETQEKSIMEQENIKQDTKQVETNILTQYKGYPVIAKLEIPKINLETYVISEYSEQALKISVTKFYGGNPNEEGNFCIAGHNYITKNMFHDLKKLSIGDTFTLIDANNNEGIYQIYLVETVEPNETQCLSQKTEGKTEVTLITCTTDSSKRIIVKAVKI